jgi:hypothetical protein
MMVLRCGVHNDEEQGNHRIFMCHHCGLPVCEDHGWVLSEDDAFDDSAEPVSRAAMHCPDHVEDHKGAAAKHHGWADPRLGPTGAGLAANPANPADPYAQQARSWAAGRS